MRRLSRATSRSLLAAPLLLTSCFTGRLWDGTKPFIRRGHQQFFERTLLLTDEAGATVGFAFRDDDPHWLVIAVDADAASIDALLGYFRAGAIEAPHVAVTIEDRDGSTRARLLVRADAVRLDDRDFAVDVRASSLPHTLVWRHRRHQGLSLHRTELHCEASATCARQSAVGRALEWPGGPSARVHRESGLPLAGQLALTPFTVLVDVVILPYTLAILIWWWIEAPTI